MKPDTTHDAPPANESTAENIKASSLPKTTSDTPLLPHAASSALSTAAGVASNATFTVKTAVDDALAWTEAKVEKLSAKTEDGTGPYGSVSTCAPSDLDPIAQGVLPAALPVPRAKEDEGRGEGKGSHRTGEDIEINQGNKVEGSRSEGKRGEN